MSRRSVLVASGSAAALIAAAAVWGWSSSRPAPLATAAPTTAAPRGQRTRPLAPAELPPLAERESEVPAEAPVVLDPDDFAEEVSSEPAPPNTAPEPLLPSTSPAHASPEVSAPRETPPPLPPALPDDVAEAPAPPARPREVPLRRLVLWSQPGMCTASGEATSAREALSARFQYWDGGERGLFHLDPRLPLDAVNPILDDLTEAEREVGSRLQLRVARPETFVYFDKQLLTAAACISPEVAAYYDGALHVAASDDDLRASVLHEYTHHALMSSGLLGPAWAQEGIAMNIARETWWRTQRWYTALQDHPFGIDDLDQSIPYKLVPDQAVQFYAQSAALVACVLESKSWGLDQLFQALTRQAGTSGGKVIYDLPEVERPSFLRGCLERWKNK